MPTSIVTMKGQTTIPKQVRDYLGLKAHDKLLYTPDNGAVLVTPMKGSLHGLRGAFKIPRWEKKPLDFKKLRREFERGMTDRAVRGLH